MLASELIKELQECIGRCGDKPVVISIDKAGSPILGEVSSADVYSDNINVIQILYEEND